MKALILFHTCPRKPKSNHARSYFIGFNPYRSFHHMQMSIIEKYGQFYCLRKRNTVFLKLLVGDVSEIFASARKLFGKLWHNKLLKGIYCFKLILENMEKRSKIPQKPFSPMLMPKIKGWANYPPPVEFRTLPSSTNPVFILSSFPASCRMRKSSNAG